MTSSLSIFRSQVAGDLMTLAQLHDQELTQSMLGQLQKESFPISLALQFEGEISVQGSEILATSINIMSKKPDKEMLDELAADFANIYLINKYSASPFESVWIDEEGLTMQEPMFQIRSWYKKYQLEVPDWRQRTDDHLVFQLQFIAALFQRDDKQSLVDAAQFMDEHLLRWLEDFARRIASRALTPFYAGLAMLTAGYIDELRDIIAQVLGEPRPGAEEIEQRMKPRQQVEVSVPTAFVPGASPSW